jgi:hypothetical protein
MQPRRIAKLLVYELLRVTRWIFYVNWVYKPTGKTTLYVYIIYIYGKVAMQRDLPWIYETCLEMS